MTLVKYKYYFRRPRSEITKDIFNWLLIGGVICIAATSPYFIVNILRSYQRAEKYPRKRLSNAFYSLKKQGHVSIKMVNKQLYVSLTEKGKRKAGFLQIDELKIKKPKKWDGRWRIVMFDIAQLKKIYRELFRGKLKELGFYPLQKSIWAHPFDCRAEIFLLKDFFGLSEEEMRFIVTDDIGDAKKIKKHFKL